MIFNIFSFILGTAVGSFLNVLIDRLPNDEPITGRSHCDHCKRRLRWYDLIPVVSFVLLKGRCRYCHKKISFQYPIIEILTGLLFVVIPSTFDKLSVNSARNLATEGSANLFNYASLDPSGFALRMTLWGIISCLIVIFFSDLKYHLISDYVLLALFGLSFIYKLTQAISHSGLSRIVVGGFWSRFAPQNDIISGLIVALPIFLIYYISHERAMGLGDVYLSAIIGFLLGWKAGFMALYIAFITGAIFGLILMVLHKKKLKSKIPFGPFLVIGTITMLFWGEKIFGIIKKIYGF